MVHTLVVALSALCVILALCGSLYVTGFAIVGIRERLPVSQVTAYTRFLVFIPAHNESDGIQATLRSIQRANYPQELIRTIVIADNCNDDTAERARACGMEAWTRSDLHNRGKGQALSWAFERAAAPFDLVAVIDADTEVGPSFFKAMDAAYASSLRQNRAEVALQGRYVFAASPPSSPWFEQFTIAAKAAENSFTYRPRTALRLANLIQGNGFCISKAALSKVPFEATSIVEDAEYAVMLALNGIPVVHVDDAQVISRITRRLKDAATQRVRWASGTFSLLGRAVPALIRGAVQQRIWQLAEMALMLLLTSRVVIMYATLASVAFLAFAGSFPLFNLLEIGLIASIALQSIYVFLVLRKSDSKPIPFQTIAFMPLYFGFIGAMQLGAVLGWKNKQWNRTNR